MNNDNNKLFISFEIDTETWGKDACELIDYDDSSLFPNSIKSNKSGRLFRKMNKIIYDTHYIYNEYNYEKLLEIKCNENDIKIIPNNIKYSSETFEIESENTSWFVFKSSKIVDKPNRYKLNRGDIIRIGRITIKIRNIVLENSVYNLKNPNENNSFNYNKNDNLFLHIYNNKDISINRTQNCNKINSKKILKNDNNILNINKHIKKRICRICYIEEENKDNPLVEPCICSGSMKYIHLNCLKKWISTKSCVQIDSSENCIIYIIKKIECELCKTKLPDYIKYNGKILEILDFHNHFKNYICLESLTIDRYKNRFLYVANLDSKDNIKIGRGHDANLIISDISVSRIHSIIYKENNLVYLKDNNSKFGSLILIQAAFLKLNELLNLNIQIGRTFCRIKKIKNFRIFGCCDIDDRRKPELIYHKQNEKELDIKKGYIIKENNTYDDEDFSSDYDNNDGENIKFEEEKKNTNEENVDKTDDVYYKLNDIKDTKNNKNNYNIISSSVIEIKENNSIANEALNGDLISIHHINNLIINKRNKNINKNNDLTGNSMSKETRILDIKNEN